MSVLSQVAETAIRPSSLIATLEITSAHDIAQCMRILARSFEYFHEFRRVRLKHRRFTDFGMDSPAGGFLDLATLIEMIGIRRDNVEDEASLVKTLNHFSPASTKAE